MHVDATVCRVIVFGGLDAAADIMLGSPCHVLQRFTEGGATAAGTDGVPLDDEEAKRLAAEAEERVKAEEEAALDLVIVHEAPKDVRPYVSETADETSEDVKRLSVHRSRPLVRGLT